MATAGQSILDATGRKLLQSDGKKQLSNGAGDDCCCGALTCFQRWSADWHCETSSWVLTPGTKQCLPSSTSTTWTGSGCTGYAIYVAMSHSCAVDGDCTGLADTAPPTTPFAGIPPDCCCCETCALDPAPVPNCCDPCPTPSQVRLTIISASGSANCSFDTANSFHVHKIDVSALIGHTFTLPYAGPCVWEDTFDVTALIRLLQCNGDGTGCGACTPTLDVTALTTMTISVSSSGGVGYNINLTSTDTELDNSPDGFAVACAADFSDDINGCCNPWSATAAGPVGTEPMEQIFITAVVVTPC